TPLPGPGTYAQHNAVDMPALLPDGTQSRLSVSSVLASRAAEAGAAARPSIGGGVDVGEGTEQAGREQAGREQAGTEQAGTEQAGTEQAGREQAGSEEANGHGHGQGEEQR